MRYLIGGEAIHEVELPTPGAEGWLHLGLGLSEGHQIVTLRHNGMALDRFEAPKPLFELVEGTLTLGADGQGPHPHGWRGWIDDFVVLAHGVDPEVACNHAAGTLIRIDDADAAADWFQIASRYPGWAHAGVAAAAGDSDPNARFACYHDYSGDYAAHLANIPAGATGQRDRILFPEGPLRAGAPRPDSSNNAFCLTCHHEDGQNGLSLDALTYDADLLLEDDPRRQPMQPPRRVFGHIPAGWIAPGAGPGGPPEPLVAPEGGALVDQWLLESAAE